MKEKAMFDTNTIPKRYQHSFHLFPTSFVKLFELGNEICWNFNTFSEKIGIEIQHFIEKNKADERSLIVKRVGRDSKEIVFFH